MTNEQISFLGYPNITEEQAQELERQGRMFKDYAKKVRNWKNGFQKWSNDNAQDGYDSYGCCGYGSMCEWCKDNSYGRPCVRALNDMCREKGLSLNIERTFEEVWRGKIT